MLTPDAIAALLEPYVRPSLPDPNAALADRVDWPRIYSQLANYIELIVKWNARINLTAIRDPEQIVRRHFGESLFAGLHLGRCASLLDFGSGAGFPGIPIQLLLPELPITLAESRSRKAAFLREVVRTLGLSTEVWAGRVETMPPARRFDTIALRAVDGMDAAIAEAGRRADRRIVVLGALANATDAPAGFEFDPPIPIPESIGGVLLIASRRQQTNLIQRD